MSQRRAIRKAWMAVLGGSLILAASLTAARAADDDPDRGKSWEQRLLDGIMRGLGADVGDKGIDYRERSPLVVPPTRDLPPPESVKALQRDPAWPEDHDLKQRKKAAATTNPWADNDPDRVLRPDELARGRKRGAGRASGTGVTENEIGRTMRPGELGYRGGLWDSLFNPKKEESEPFRGEPPRASLTEPPPGYQTPSPKYPYGVSPEKKTPLPTVTDRAVGVEGR